METPDYTARITSFDSRDLRQLCGYILFETDLIEIPYLWIDVISADKQNYEGEKEAILKMSTIYKKATCILTVPDLDKEYLWKYTANRDIIALLKNIMKQFIMTSSIIILPRCDRVEVIGKPHLTHVGQLKNTREEQLKNHTRKEQLKNTHKEQLKNTRKEQLKNTHKEQLKDNTHKEQLKNTREEQLKKTREEQLKNTREEQLKNTRKEQLKNTRKEQLKNTHKEQLKNTREEQLKNTHKEQLKNTHKDDEHTSTIYYKRDNIRINDEKVTILPVFKNNGTPVNYIQPPINFPLSPAPSTSTSFSASSTSTSFSAPSTSLSPALSTSKSYPVPQFTLPLSNTETPNLYSKDVIPENFNKMIKKNIYEVDAMIKTYKDRILKLKKKRKLMLELCYE
ncbi:unnamed protein product [Cunninghamella echinulata]